MQGEFGGKKCQQTRSVPCSGVKKRVFFIPSHAFVDENNIDSSEKNSLCIDSCDYKNGKRQSKTDRKKSVSSLLLSSPSHGQLKMMDVGVYYFWHFIGNCVCDGLGNFISYRVFFPSQEWSL